jgi:DNA-binding NarL/FixJ family response regulator
MATKLLIVDEHRVLSQGLEALFAGEPDFDPMVVANPEQALAVAAANKPDAVLMDVRLGSVSGIELARRLTLLPSAPVVIVLTADSDLATAVEVIRAGAAGFIAKSASVEQVMSAVRVAALGGTWLPAGLLAALLAGFRAPPDGQRDGQEPHRLAAAPVAEHGPHLYQEYDGEARLPQRHRGGGRGPAGGTSPAMNARRRCVRASGVPAEPRQQPRRAKDYRQIRPHAATPQVVEIDG